MRPQRALLLPAPRRGERDSFCSRLAKQQTPGADCAKEI